MSFWGKKYSSMEIYGKNKNRVAGRAQQVDPQLLDKQYLYITVKRIFDCLTSVSALVLLLPLFLVLAILIKLDDPKGTVFFSQIRIGKRGTAFRMYKFRSMCVDAESKLDKLAERNEIDGAMFKIKEDPRITRIGHFIRRTSLDELPQLYNVLRGEMSLVGPRPCLPQEYATYTDYDKQRVAVIPGCTGLWQVSGRNGLSFDQMVDLDCQYINHRSILTDIVILLKTFRVFIIPNQAY